MAKKITQKFDGYTPDVKEFFRNLKNNNTKSWFDDHREFYINNIREVTKTLVNDMGMRFARLGLPYIADPKRSLFRINRDIRFSNNKDPYKTNLGVFFPFSLSPTVQKPVHAMGLYFHFEDSETFIAGGIHSPMPSDLKAIRKRISQDWEELIKITK